jgi:hypothetical protein
VNGEVDLSPAQVSAALGLIKKTLPDLQAVSLEGNMDHKVKVEGALKWQAPQ